MAHAPTRTHPHQWSAPRLGAAQGHSSFYHRFKRPASYRISLLGLDLLQNPTSTTKRDLTRPPSYLGSSASSLRTDRPSALSKNPGDYRARAACPTRNPRPCQQTRCPRRGRLQPCPTEVLHCPVSKWRTDKEAPVLRIGRWRREDNRVSSQQPLGPSFTPHAVRRVAHSSQSPLCPGRLERINGYHGQVYAIRLFRRSWYFIAS